MVSASVSTYLPSWASLSAGRESSVQAEVKPRGPRLLLISVYHSNRETNLDTVGPAVGIHGSTSALVGSTGAVKKTDVESPDPLDSDES